MSTPTPPGSTALTFDQWVKTRGTASGAAVALLLVSSGIAALKFFDVNVSSGASFISLVAMLGVVGIMLRTGAPNWTVWFLSFALAVKLLAFTAYIPNWPA